MTENTSTVTVEDCAEKLSQFYIEMLLSSHTWPPLKIVQFVELALIQQEKNALHIGLKTVTRDIDEVCGHKTKVLFNDLFKEIDNGQLLLFEGRPGSGKTTLMLKVSCDWGKGEILQSAKIVILLQLRRLNKTKHIYLHNLIKTSCNRLSVQEIQCLSSYIERSCGEGVVFILDGFDEYSSPASEDNLINKLLTRELFSKSVVIVSSRPAATKHLRMYANKYIEVVGFVKSQIYDYIDIYYKDKQKANHLIKHLEDHPNLLNICYLPLHCAMLTHLSEYG